MAKVPVALQMFTLRDLAREDFPGTLRAVAQIGYAGVELAGYGGLSGPELKRLLDDVGLAVAGDHVSLDRLENALGAVIELEHALGNRFVVVPSIPEPRRRDAAGYLSVAETLNRIGVQLQREELQLCYHNHAFEFERIEGQYALDLLLGNTDPALVKWEPDVYWIVRGGEDPAALIRRYRGRCPLIHLKDMTGDEARTFAEVGEGIIDFRPIFAAAEEGGVAWYIVEQDRCSRPPLESVRLSFEHLRTWGIA